MKVSCFIEDQTCVAVYDPSTKLRIAIFDNYRKAADGLGITSKVVKNRATNKSRIFSPALKKEVALRVTRKESLNA